MHGLNLLLLISKIYFRLETDFIEEIVTNIYHQLGVLLRSTLPQDPQLIGIDMPIHFVSSWLRDGSEHTADILTYWVWVGSGRHLWPKMSISYIVVNSTEAALLKI